MKLWEHRESGCQPVPKWPQTIPVGGHPQSQSLEVLGIIHIQASVRGADKNVSKDGPMPGTVLTMGRAIGSMRGPGHHGGPVPVRLLCRQLIWRPTASPPAWHCSLLQLIHTHVIYKARFSRKEEKPWQATWVYFQPHKINMYQGSV